MLSPYKLSLLLYLVHICGAIKTQKGVLNKCCLFNQQYVLDGDNTLQCVNIDKETKPPDWWWIPKHVMALANSSKKFNEAQKQSLLQSIGNQNIFYGAKPNCNNNSKDFLFNNLKKKKHEFNFIVYPNEIRLKVFKTSSLHDPNIGHRATFPSSSYCVDSGPDMFVVLLCPCSTLQCVRKCCGISQAYNETESACQEVPQVPDWLPGIIRPDSKNNAEYYRLVNAKQQLNCPETTVHVIKDVRSKFFLLEDGSIQALDTDRIFPPYEYCVDHTVHKEELVHFCHHPDDLYYMFGFVFKSFAVVCLVISVVVLVGAHVRYIYDNCHCCSF